MGRVFAIVLVVTSIAGSTAFAETKRKVRIETDPPGAVVYLNEKEAGPVCDATPCTIDAPIGSTPVIVELKDHESKFENLVIPKRGRVAKVTFTLEPAIGTINVEGPAGATVLVDDVDQGKAPVKVETSAEAHHVVVQVNGKVVYDNFVDVQSGNETVVSGKEVATGDGEGDGDGDAELPDDGEGDGNASGGGTVTKSTKVATPRERFVRASVLVDVGFRTFSYEGVASEAKSNLRKESEGGQVLAGPVIELWPGTLAGVPVLRGLSLMGRFQFGLNQQPVEGSGLSDSVTTFWQSLEISLRHRWLFKDKFGLEVGAGYVRDQYRYSGSPGDILKLPDVDYQSIRIGARGSIKLGQLEPYLALESRIVTSMGKLEARFDPSTGASGLRAAIGVGAQRGKFSGRAEATFTRYGWDIQSSDVMFKADSGTDSIQQIGVSVGYEY